MTEDINMRSMSIVDKREGVFHYMEHINWMETNIFSRFDKLGCMYVENANVHRPDWKQTDRLYRRNDISYGISFDTVVVYLYDENFNLITEVDYAVDYDFTCPTCFDEDTRSEYYTLYKEIPIDILIGYLDMWLKEAEIDYTSSEPSS